MKEAADQAASIQPRALGAPLYGKIPERRTCNREQHHNSTYFHGLIERSIFNVGDVVITVHCHRNLRLPREAYLGCPGASHYQLKSQIEGSP
jgi:hypothetical protein